ncbi:aldo/keto reductase [Candidatus Woesearchaeota archaeon]|nr:aldo/keto reductase [Candidatus Woesearchaeota archaeon]
MKTQLVQGTGDYFWNHRNSEAKKLEILQTGIEIGLSLIDTAEGYGAGASERLIGQLAQSNNKRRYRVATKVSPEHLRFEDVLAACEASLIRLHLDTIYLYQIHWPNPAVPIEETMLALAKLAYDGKIQYIGFSNFTEVEILQAWKYIPELHDRTRFLQYEYNWFERSVEHMASFTEENVFLTYSPFHYFQYMNDAQRLGVRPLLEKYECTLYQLALSWLQRHGAFICPIVRTTNVAHLKDNIKNIDLAVEDVVLLNRLFPEQIYYVQPDDIQVESGGEWDRQAYRNMVEAKENRLGLCPSPEHLAENFRQGGQLLKPVRITPIKSMTQKQYQLIGGRVSFWAWYLAFGNKPIPCYIR